jgi:hypothetical protein
MSARRSVMVAAALGTLMAGVSTRSLPGQVFQLQGAGSSLYSGYGGMVNIWGSGYEGAFALGYLDGFRLSAFAKAMLGHDTLRLGNDVIPIRLPTDMFSASSGVMVQGASIERVAGRTRILAFGGLSATPVAAPQFLASKSDRGMGVVQIEQRMADSLRFVSHAVISERQTFLQGIEWTPSRAVRAGLTGGIGANDPYAAASFQSQGTTADFKAAYVFQGNSFRRAAVPMPVQSETDRENILLTLKPRPDVSFGIGRQNFRQDSTTPGTAQRASIDQVFGSARFRGTNVAAGVFEALSDGTRNISSYFSARRDLSRWLQTDFYLLNVWAPAPSRTSTPVLYLREFLTPRLNLLQVITRSNNRTTVSFGGDFVSGLASVGVDYQIVHTPYRQGNPFVQALALNVKLQLGGYQLTGGTFVTPDGRVNYSASGSTFLYMGESAGGGPSTPQIRFERYIVQGRVVDTTGAPIEGAAIELGKDVVFTDSHGQFFLRVSSDRTMTLHVLTGDFLATGRFEVAKAPTTASPGREGRAADIEIVVRRVLPPRQ